MLMRYLLRQCLLTPFVLLTILLTLFLPKKRQKFIWGPTPIISNQYWADAMRAAGYDAVVLLSTVPTVRRNTMSGLYYNDLIPRWVRPEGVRRLLGPCFALSYILRQGKVLHLSFQGGPLGDTLLWRLEAYLLRWAGVKTIVMPFGSDAYMTSKVLDISVRHGLLLSIPNLYQQEAQITSRVHYWSQQADIVMSWFMVDGLGRWDVACFSGICLDTDEWQAKTTYSPYDGRNGPVKVVHTPNFRGFKGSEFLVQAVQELQAEGLQIELKLLEKVPNTQVRELMPQMDILMEQLLIGYALSGMEGMASGLPVLSNLDNEVYTRLFRRYGYLNECPILSTTPETLKENLRVLVTDPILREQLGRAGRHYVEKYHSFQTAQYLFGAIYDKILDGKAVDLMNLFHPLKAEYNRRLPKIEHPLIENHLPIAYQRERG